MTTDAALREAYLARLGSEDVVLGSTGSRLLSGCTPAHSALEARLASHFAAPSALLFNSGWDANVSFFGVVPQASDFVVYDELVHASVHSGMRGSRVPVPNRLSFAHNDPYDLAAVLKRIPLSPRGTLPTVFLALESLYSMDGDFAPLPALLAVMDEHVPRSQQCVVVDEAHSTGVYGAGGRGIVHAAGEAAGEGEIPLGRVTIRLMTFGKGVGCSGAALLCPPVVRSFLINFARPFIFSTAPPLSTVHALQTAWDYLSSSAGDAKREDLYATIGMFKTRITQVLSTAPADILRLPEPTPVPFTGTPHLPAEPPAPIIPILSPTPHALSAFLLERGFVVRPVVPPTVPPGGERVRVCLRAGMERDVLERLVAAFGEWVQVKVAEREGGALAKL